jgi:aldehyde dehydrogenase (NAD+)
MTENLIPQLLKVSQYFESGITLDYDFRRKALENLKAALLRHEKDIYAALYADLKKSPEEAWASELGLIIGDLRNAIKNLREWMRPQRVPTDLVNLPSISKIYSDPLGVVLIVGPWNYPIQLLMMPLIGAIAGGNAVVIKPSELAPASSSLLSRIISEIYPEDYIKVIEGDGAEIVPYMMKNFRFDHVFYTGSIPVGRAVYQLAAEKLVPVTLELGGKSPAIVEKDAPLAQTTRRIILGKFLNVGQTCISPDYALVHNSIRDAFLKKMNETIKKFYTENPSASYDLGKILNAKRFDKLVSYLSEGKIVIGGKYDREKLFIEPTVITGLSMESPLMKEEIFGPILPVIGFDTREEAMNLVKQNANPLAFYLFTENKQAQEEWLRKVPFGGGCINTADWHFANHHLPFGGVGNSGMGAYHGKYSFDTFTRKKSILKSPQWFDPALKYPGFKGKLGIFKKLIG